MDQETQRFLEKQIRGRWKYLTPELVGTIMRRTDDLAIDPEQIVRCLDALVEYRKPGPVEQQIIVALRSLVVRPFREATAEPSIETDDARFFRSIRLAGGWPTDWTDEQVVRGMAEVIRDKARRNKGVTTADILVCLGDFKRFTRLEWEDIVAEVIDIYGQDARAYFESAERRQARTAARRATERAVTA